MAHSGHIMNTFAGRLATFEIEHQLAKRRASSQKKKTASTATWPHDTPAPKDLARAGFFYKPSTDTDDNVQCFHCSVRLDGWEAGDVALSEHLAHSPDCAWAINVSVADLDEERDPMSDVMADARKATFGDSWPYEHKKGWKCKTLKMVEGGWCYDPAPDVEDGVTCFYCGLSLDGWEPKDNPLEEHRRRSSDCAFFILTERHASINPRPKVKGRARSSSRGSKASRLSTQSVQSTFSEAPSLESLGDVALDADVDNSIASVASTMSTAAKGRKKAVRTATTAKGKKKGTKAPSEEPSVLYPRIEDSVQIDDASARREISAQPENVSHAKHEPLTDEPIRKPTKGKAKAKQTTKTHHIATQDESQLLSELQDSAHDAPVEQEQPKPKRGVKRTSDGHTKSEEPSSVMIDDAPAKPKKSSKTAKAKMAKKIPKLSQEDNEMDSAVAEPMPVEQNPPASKAKRSRKVIEQMQEQQAPQPEEAFNEEEMPAETSLSEENFVVFAHTPEPDEFEPSPTPRRMPSAHQPSARKPISPSAIVPSAHSTPRSSRSQQSSDAENRPPSSGNRAPSTAIKASVVESARKPSAPVVAPQTQAHNAFTSPTKTIRIPVAASTPTRSPSRRSPQKLGQLTSSIAWTATDLETLFLASPDKMQASDAGMTRAALLEGGVDALTSPEKKMTVEEWVRWRAGQGEEKLRRDCERLVSLFETEGGRGLRVLGGIQVASGAE